MTYGELKQVLFEIIDDYFDDAIVEWGSLDGTKPDLPFVKLQLGAASRTLHDFSSWQAEEHYAKIPYKTRLYVEFFTNGEMVECEEGIYYENNAVDRMTDFLNYMVSPYADILYRENNIYVWLDGEVQDTTAVLDNDFEFRAAVELTVTYMEELNGLNRRRNTEAIEPAWLTKDDIIIKEE